MYRPTRARLRAYAGAGAAVLVGATLLGCGLGSTPGDGTTISRGTTAASAAGTAASPTAAQTVKIGTSLNVATDTYSGTYTVSKVEKRVGKGTQPGIDDLGMAADKGAWILAYVTVEITQADTMICTCDWTLVGPDNAVYDPSYGTFHKHDDLQSVDLNAGQHAAGWLFFDIPPAAAKGATLQLKVSAIFNAPAYGYWQL